MRKETSPRVCCFGDGFARFWIVAVMVFALGYTPVHLILEPHGNGHMELAEHEHDGGADHHREGDHADHEDENHAHHHEIEHGTTALTPGKLKLNGFVFCIVGLTLETFAFETKSPEVDFLLESEVPPEASPPPPLQPRAPPTV